MKIGIERIGSAAKRLAEDALGISAYHFGYQHPERFDDELEEHPLFAGLCAAVYEVIFPSDGRLGRKFGEQLSKPMALTAILRDSTSLISSVIIGAAVIQQSNHLGLGLSAAAFSKLTTNTIIHQEVRGLINRLDRSKLPI